MLSDSEESRVRFDLAAFDAAGPRRRFRFDARPRARIALLLRALISTTVF